MNQDQGDTKQGPENTFCDLKYVQKGFHSHNQLCFTKVEKDYFLAKTLEDESTL